VGRKAPVKRTSGWRDLFEANGFRWLRTHPLEVGEEYNQEDLSGHPEAPPSSPVIPCAWRGIQ